MTRGCDHTAERKGGGRNNRSSKRRMKASNNPNGMGTGAGRASPWRGRGAASHGWRDQPFVPRAVTITHSCWEEVAAPAVPGGTSSKGPELTVPTC